jgi:hypothetical protein
MSGVPVITAPLHGRITIRAPFEPRMRERLVGCGGTPQWEPRVQVWSMPRQTLGPVTAELAGLFGEVDVQLELDEAPTSRSGPAGGSPADPSISVDDVELRQRGGGTWLTYVARRQRSRQPR